MNFKETLDNIAERKFYGRLLSMFRPAIRISTKDWAEKYRVMSSVESAIVGKFDCMLTPWMIYVMECLDNPDIPVIVGRKSAQIAWTETLNNHRGKRIHTDPCKMILAFARDKSITKFYKQKWKPFYTKTKVLRELINIDVAKEGREYFTFPGGDLSLITLGAIGDQKSVSAPYQEIEEPDDAGTDVSGQGDSLANLQERQKTFPKHRRKIIFGGTPTVKDFSRVDAAYLQSNRMVYKAECHECGQLHELSFDNLKEDDYQDRFIDEIYGKKNPNSAYYQCPHCETRWSFEQKNINVTNGLRHGNKGWHITKPEVDDVYGFTFNELLSPFEASNFVNLSKARIKAQIELEKGKEGPMKSFVNNKMGLSYASGVSSIEAEELKLLRSNYQEHIIPYEGLILTAGVDVQDNRFAIVIRAWGRNNNSWLVSWYEIFGDVKVQEQNDDGSFKGIWGELSHRLVHSPIPHVTGKKLQITALSIDSADNTELVYRWVLAMQQHNPHVMATKGVRDLRFSEDEIYSDPAARMEANTTDKLRATLHETMGVTLYQLGAHRAHGEILTRIALNKKEEARSNRYYFNEQSYGQYEEQMTSCRKIIDVNSEYNKSVFKLIPGKRKEAMDAEKQALHANYAVGIRNFTDSHWRELEQYVYN
jgi:phage terminase large subunit GpA-like protein